MTGDVSFHACFKVVSYSKDTWWIYRLLLTRIIYAICISIMTNLEHMLAKALKMTLKTVKISIMLAPALFFLHHMQGPSTYAAALSRFTCHCLLFQESWCIPYNDVQSPMTWNYMKAVSSWNFIGLAWFSCTCISNEKEGTSWGYPWLWHTRKSSNSCLYNWILKMWATIYAFTSLFWHPTQAVYARRD